MAKRPSKHLRPARPLSSSHASAAMKTDGRWIVRTVAGATAVKTYTCPGCNHPIKPGTPHIVAWASEPGFWTDSPVSERRHWHSACWHRKP